MRTTMRTLLLLSLKLILLIIAASASAATKTRSLPRQNGPDEAWEQIKLRSRDEILAVLDELGIGGDGDDDGGIEDMDDDELRSFAYDEDAMEAFVEDMIVGGDTNAAELTFFQCAIRKRQVERLAKKREHMRAAKRERP